ncbi:hypothetical protein UB51_17655 [Paenibacillus sp. IHBB 10380]|nr:hypothetical protein UB51_17655 [Paenibacillus sp. IHBB 10380]
MLLKFRTSNTLINFLGVGFIILGVVRLTPLYKLVSDSLLAFTLTAFLLILSDFTQFISEKYDNLENLEEYGTETLKKDKILLFLISLLHSALVALSAISLIVIPYLDLSRIFSVNELTSINDMLTLSGLGIAISLIGLKSKRMQDKEFKEIADAVGEKISREFANSPETKELIKNLVMDEFEKTDIENVVNKVVRNLKKES